MNRKSAIKLAFAIITCAIVLVIRIELMPSRNGETASQYRDANTKNLMQCWSILLGELGKSDGYPQSLRDLTLKESSDYSFFVLPGSTNQTTSISSIEQWTDYIYIGNGIPMPGAALMISPPENHGGNSGYVLLQGGVVLRMSPVEIRRLIANPLMLVSNQPPQVVEYQRNRITVCIPDKLLPYYPTNKK
jgi:hypothetical protein